MVGYLHFTGSRGRVQLVPHDVLGLTVCEARLPKAEKSRFAPRRMRKALDRLDRAGCRRLLSPCALMPWYPVVRTRSLWQAMAVPLTLTYLRSQGLDPRRSVVALRGDRMTRSLYKTCLALAGEVSALSLDLRQDDGLVWRLQQELGLPVESPEHTGKTGTVTIGGNAENAWIVREEETSKSHMVARVWGGDTYPCYGQTIGEYDREWYYIWVDGVWGWVSSGISTYTADE